MQTFSKKDRFSLRKYKGIGLASCLLGSFYFIQGPLVNAETPNTEVEIVSDYTASDTSSDDSITVITPDADMIGINSEDDNEVDVLAPPVAVSGSMFRNAQQPTTVELVANEQGDGQRLKISFSPSLDLRDGSTFDLTLHNGGLYNVINDTILRIENTVVGSISETNKQNTNNNVNRTHAKLVNEGHKNITKEDVKNSITDVLNTQTTSNMTLTFNKAIETFGANQRILFINVVPKTGERINRDVGVSGFSSTYEGKVYSENIYADDKDRAMYDDHFEAELQRLGANNREVSIEYDGNTVASWGLNYRLAKYFTRSITESDVDTRATKLGIESKGYIENPNDRVVHLIKDVPGLDMVSFDDGTLRGTRGNYHMSESAEIAQESLKVTIRLSEDSAFAIAAKTPSTYTTILQRKVGGYVRNFSNDQSVFIMEEVPNGKKDKVNWNVTRVSDRELVFTNKDAITLNEGDSHRLFELYDAIVPKLSLGGGGLALTIGGADRDGRVNGYDTFFTLKPSWRSTLDFDTHTGPLGYTIHAELSERRGGMGNFVPVMEKEYTRDRFKFTLRNTGIGERATGTVIARHYHGEQLLKETTIATNQPWKQVYDYTAPQIQGYRFSKVRDNSEYKLNGFVGEGTHYIDLEYVPELNKVTEPIEIATRYEADANRDRGERYTRDQGAAGVREYDVVNGQRQGEGRVTQPMRERVILVGTRVTEALARQGRREDIEFTTRYEAVNDVPKGSTRVPEPTGGTRGVRYYYKDVTVNPANGNLIEGAEREYTPLTVQPVERVIYVATGPTMSMRTLPKGVQYVADNDAEKGTRTTQEEGHDGSVTTRTSYTLNTSNGQVTANSPTESRVTPVDMIVKVGTRPTDVTHTTAITTRYVADPSRKAGEHHEESAGQAGQRVTRTYWQVNPQSGDVTELRTEDVSNRAMIQRVVKVGTKSTETTTTIPRRVRYVEDPNRNHGETFVEQEGRDSVRRGVVTYTLNEADGTVIPSPPSTNDDQGEDRVIKVGTKPTEVVQPLKRGVQYVADISVEKGQRATTVNGRDGSITTITTYTMNPNDGSVTANAPTERRVDAIDKVIQVGARPTIERTKIPRPVEYVEDPARTHGESIIEVNGRDGETIVTISWQVDAQTGDITEKGRTSRTEDAVAKRVKVGTRPTVNTVTDPKGVRYVEDPTRPHGERFTHEQGQDGKTTTTITYTLNRQNGQVLPNEPQIKTIERRDTVIKVGTQPTITVDVLKKPTHYIGKQQAENETEGEDGSVTITTTYTMDPNTGNVTPNTPTITRKEPKPKVVKVDADNRVTVTPIPREVHYFEDHHLTGGVSRVDIEGSDGSRTETIIYRVDPQSGALIEADRTVETVDPIAKVISVGTKELREPHGEIPITTTYVADPLLTHGEKVTDDEGLAGRSERVTRYTVNIKTGNVTPVTTIENSPMRPRIVRVGTKPRIEVETIPVVTEFIADPYRPYGERTPESVGTEGKITHTITYKLDTQTGEVREENVSVYRLGGTPTRIFVGTSPSVATTVVPKSTSFVPDNSLEGGKTTITEGRDGLRTETTHYTVDPETGIIIKGKTTVDTLDPVADVTHVGVAPTREVRTIEVVRRYTADPTKSVGDNVTTEGQAGSVTTITYYRMDGDHAVVDRTETNTVDMTPTITALGTKPIDIRRPIPKTIAYTKDDALAVGETRTDEGQDGYQTIHVTYEVDEKTGVLTPHETVTETIEPKSKIIKVGTKPSITREVIPAVIEYVEDYTLEAGDRSNGQDGTSTVVTTTITYTVDPETGAVTPNAPVVERQEGKKGKVRVGVKPKVTVDILPDRPIYIADATSETGSQTSDGQGFDGSVTTTITYTLNPKTGEITENVPTIKRIEPKRSVVKVGVKMTQPRITPLLHGIQYVADNTLEAGSRVEDVSGKNGKRMEWIVYDVHRETGELIEVDRRVEVEYAVPTVMRVGTKSRVEDRQLKPKGVRHVPDVTLEVGRFSIETQGRDWVERTETTYTLNTQTGELTPQSHVSTIEGEDIVIRVGIKPSVEVVKTIPFATIKNPVTTLRPGETYIVQQGKNGEVLHVTHYKVDELTGRVEIDHVETVEHAVVNQVMMVGTDGNGSGTNGNSSDVDGNGSRTNGNSSGTNGNGSDTNGNGSGTNGNGSDTNGKGSDTNGTLPQTGDTSLIAPAALTAMSSLALMAKRRKRK